MLQVLQSLSDGRVEVAEVPCPAIRHGHLLIETTNTLVSAGTERMLLEFGKANPLQKARQQPDKLRQAIAKARTDGIQPTLEAIRSKLEQPLASGYCNVGRVADVGTGVAGFSIGDRVVSNGKHAEFTCVPKNLCAKIPDAVSDQDAAFTVVGSIGLQGIRLAQPTLGETFVVTGLGLIGLLTVQLLRAHGCRVLGLDFDKSKLELASQFGAECVDLSAVPDPVATAMAFSRGRGVDGVLITAATSSQEPIRQAAAMCRKRGRIVLIGVAGTNISRSDFYDKELSFSVSCSYGPGRYDNDYEKLGFDFPIGYVRWTAQRNFEAVLDMMADGRLCVDALVSHRFPIRDAAQAYEVLAAPEPVLGISLDFAGQCDARPVERARTIIMSGAPRRPETDSSNTRVAVIGAGGYALKTLLPAFCAAGAELRWIGSQDGVSSLHAGRRFKARRVTTDLSAIFDDPEVDAVVIATRHDTHADLICRSLAAGKSVFAEKPLALDGVQLADVKRSITSAPDPSKILAVGFNRRFAPHVRVMKELLQGVRTPKSLVYTVNAGEIPEGHWVHSPQIGGGRIVGEACHFIDLARYLVGAPIRSVAAIGVPGRQDDVASISLRFEEGSCATIHYFANGHSLFPKERVEVFCEGRILQLDNFRRLRAFGWPKLRKLNLWRQNKGQHECVQAFLQGISTGREPIAFAELEEVTRASFVARDQLHQHNSRAGSLGDPDPAAVASGAVRRSA